jgi:hypothetical protein
LNVVNVYPGLGHNYFQATTAKTKRLVNDDYLIRLALVFGQGIIAGDAQVQHPIPYLAYNVGGPLKPDFNLGQGSHSGNIKAGVAFGYFQVAIL